MKIDLDTAIETLIAHSISQQAELMVLKSSLRVMAKALRPDADWIEYFEEYEKAVHQCREQLIAQHPLLSEEWRQWLKDQLKGLDGFDI